MNFDNVVAPFTDDEVHSLNEFQKCGFLHPFTCECGEEMVADNAGWLCEKCNDHVQDWAVRMMTDMSWKQLKKVSGTNNNE